MDPESAILDYDVFRDISSWRICTVLYRRKSDVFFVGESGCFAGICMCSISVGIVDKSKELH